MMGRFLFAGILIAQIISQILVSVISMLGDPNPDSPANLDAAVRSVRMWALLAIT
jgi:hypothetical protein